MNEQRAIDEKFLIALKDEGNYTIPESDYGKAEIWFINDYYFVFSIPMYGGRPVFEEVFPPLSNKKKQVNKILDLVDTWT